MKVFRMVNENHICRLCVGTGMNEGIQIYKFNNAAVYEQDFYNMTRLNFMYNRRHIFTFNKNGMEYNKYFTGFIYQLIVLSIVFHIWTLILILDLIILNIELKKK